MNALPGHGNGGTKPSASGSPMVAFMALAVWALAVAAVGLGAALLAGVWVHGIADLFQAGWDLWSGR